MSLLPWHGVDPNAPAAVTPRQAPAPRLSTLHVELASQGLLPRGRRCSAPVRAGLRGLGDKRHPACRGRHGHVMGSGGGPQAAVREGATGSPARHCEARPAAHPRHLAGALPRGLGAERQARRATEEPG